MTGEIRNIKLQLEYDGTEYHGWQTQENARTVQGELERALAVITGEPLRVTGASRTDAGVHAKGQVCNCHTRSHIPILRFPAAINSNLPCGIAVVAAWEVAADFHSRIHAQGKLYSYRISTREAPLTLERRYVLHYPRHLDIDQMQAAGRYLIGEHDFASFQAAGSSVQGTVRTIWSLDVRADGQSGVWVTVSGNGFLYNMVRIIVGTILQVGTGRLAPDDLQRILAAQNRTVAGPTAPARGLCLETVYYDHVGTNLDTVNSLG